MSMENQFAGARVQKGQASSEGAVRLEVTYFNELGVPRRLEGLNLYTQISELTNTPMGEVRKGISQLAAKDLSQVEFPVRKD